MSKKRAFHLGLASALGAASLASCAAPPPCVCPAQPPVAATADDQKPPERAEHAVRTGETLVWIARSYGVSVEGLARLNDLEDLDRIEVGQRLRLPDRAKLVYLVRLGDTLASIASSYDVPVSTIAKRNGLQDEQIEVGQLLVLPQGARIPSPPPARPGRTREDGAAPVNIRLARADALLALAEDEYLSAHFDVARERAREAAALAEAGGSKDLSARAAFVEGSALAGLGRDEDARLAFERIRAIDPQFAPPSEWLSPRIRALYRPEAERSPER